MMWARIKVAIGEKDPEKINPSNFKFGVESLSVKFENVEVEMQPNNPVEKVSWDDVMEYIGSLNQLSKSSDAKVQAILKDFIPGHQQGDEYALPSDAQWEFVMRNRGQANAAYFDLVNKAELPKYAWYEVNANEQTHAVATRLPRMIDGKPFYDLEGNVNEWTLDLWDGKSPLSGGKDPISTSGSGRAVLRGGGYLDPAGVLDSGNRYYTGRSARGYYIGFRLVRTRP
jgi:formylglycine-generating enzyme required for sulfatase activity